MLQPIFKSAIKAAINGGIGANIDSVIEVQPKSFLYTEGSPVSIMIEASKAISYTWEESLDGGETWATLTGWDGLGTSTISLSSAPTSIAGNLYRCVVTTPTETVNSVSAVAILITPSIGELYSTAELFNTLELHGD